MPRTFTVRVTSMDEAKGCRTRLAFRARQLASRTGRATMNDGKSALSFAALLAITIAPSAQAADEIAYVGTSSDSSKHYVYLDSIETKYGKDNGLTYNIQSINVNLYSSYTLSRSVIWCRSERFVFYSQISYNKNNEILNIVVDNDQKDFSLSRKAKDGSIAKMMIDFVCPG